MEITMTSTPNSNKSQRNNNGNTFPSPPLISRSRSLQSEQLQNSLALQPQLPSTTSLWKRTKTMIPTLGGICKEDPPRKEDFLASLKKKSEPDFKSWLYNSQSTKKKLGEREAKSDVTEGKISSNFLGFAPISPSREASERSRRKEFSSLAFPELKYVSSLIDIESSKTPQKKTDGFKANGPPPLSRNRTVSLEGSVSSPRDSSFGNSPNPLLDLPSTCTFKSASENNSPRSSLDKAIRELGSLDLNSTLTEKEENTPVLHTPSLVASSSLSSAASSSYPSPPDYQQPNTISLASSVETSPNTRVSINVNSIGLKSPHRRNAASTSDSQLHKNSNSRPNSSSSSASFPTFGSESSISLSSQQYINEYDTLNNQTERPAPSPSMHWRKVPDRGERPLKPLRAHSATLVGDHIVIFGGCNSRSCYNDIFLFDTDTMYWSKPEVLGTPPSPRRAHSATLVHGTKLFIFGGGNSSQYYNDLHVLDTTTLTWTTPPTCGDAPTPRRAHSTCFYNNSLYVFGGGDGLYPLNDLYRLDLTTKRGFLWTKIITKGTPPPPRGYHTATLVDSKGQLLIYGGSDGSDCFDDLFILDLETFTWKEFQSKTQVPRLAHTSTQIGPFLYVVGGRNNRHYSSDIMVLNLQRGSWENRKVFGNGPSPRGYHTTLLHDSRLFVFGGYDGTKFHNEMFVLDLSAFAYLSSIVIRKLNFPTPSGHTRQS